MLNPNPINTKATANIMIESAAAEIASPIDIAETAAINVWLVFLASFPASASDVTLDTPKTKNNNKMSVSVIPLSFRNAG